MLPITSIPLIREDLLHPFVSGNKLRKLKYPLMEAKQLGKSALVTFGGAFSNHLLATACAGAENGLKTIGIVRGEEPQPLNDVLFLCKMFGMELRFISRDDYRLKPQYFETHFDQSHYFIDEGGKGELAIQGVEEAVEHWPQTDHLILGVGTGTTLAGVIRGVNRFNRKTQVHGISVLKGLTSLEDEIKQALPTRCKTSWTVHHDFHRGGYAKMDRDLLNFIKQYTSKTGVLIDHVYMGKVLMAANEMLANGALKKDESVAVVHTGGWTGILGAKSKFF